MNPNELNLNLLPVFDCVLRERSITRASDALGLSQPAVSNALARLRAATQDPLFVRTADGMVPTAYAERIAPPLQQALAMIRATLQGARAFDAGTSDRRFTLYVTDLGEVHFLPRLLARLNAEAPQVRIRTLPTPRASPQTALQSGEVDLAIGNLPELRAGFYQQRLFRERYACIVRTDHTFIGGKLTLRQFRRAGHVLATPAGTGHDAIERMLVRRGLRRHIVLEVQHFLALPAIVAQTDLVGIVPRSVGQQILRNNDVKLLELPFPAPAFDVRQCWHARAHDDPGNRWLRHLLAELFAAVGQDSAPTDRSHETRARSITGGGAPARARPDSRR